MTYRSHWRKSLIIGLFALAPFTGSAHEYWIEPQGPAVLAPGAQLQAEFKVGQHFKGSRQSYIPNNIEQVELRDPAGALMDLNALIGQRPAIDVPATEPGTYVAALVTTYSSLVWRTEEKFLNFLKYDGLMDALPLHQARGLPPKDFRETYARSGKALLQVGDSALSDQVLGLPLEVILLERNGETMLIEVRENGEPLADHQLRTFQKRADEITEEETQTNALGQASVDVSGGGLFMLNIVTLREPSQPQKDEVWHSWWGTLSFKLPES